MGLRRAFRSVSGPGCSRPGHARYELLSAREPQTPFRLERCSIRSHLTCESAVADGPAAMPTKDRKRAWPCERSGGAGGGSRQPRHGPFHDPAVAGPAAGCRGCWRRRPDRDREAGSPDDQVDLRSTLAAIDRIRTCQLPPLARPDADRVDRTPRPVQLTTRASECGSAKPRHWFCERIMFGGWLWPQRGCLGSGRVPVWWRRIRRPVWLAAVSSSKFARVRGGAAGSPRARPPARFSGPQRPGTCLRSSRGWPAGTVAAGSFRVLGFRYYWPDLAQCLLP